MHSKCLQTPIIFGYEKVLRLGQIYFSCVQFISLTIRSFNRGDIQGKIYQICTKFLRICKSISRGVMYAITRLHTAQSQVSKQCVTMQMGAWICSAAMDIETRITRVIWVYLVPWRSLTPVNRTIQTMQLIQFCYNKFCIDWSEHLCL